MFFLLVSSVTASMWEEMKEFFFNRWLRHRSGSEICFTPEFQSRRFADEEGASSEKRESSCEPTNCILPLAHFSAGHLLRGAVPDPALPVLHIVAVSSSTILLMWNREQAVKTTFCHRQTMLACWSNMALAEGVSIDPHSVFDSCCIFTGLSV